MSSDKLYENTARIYDIVEFGGVTDTKLTNQLIVDHLNRANAKTVLDMTCGTGAQSLALSLQGFKVTGSDLCEEMLEVAREKSPDKDIEYIQANMIDVSLGQFDGIISMYNAIGHLTPKEFSKTIRNASEHLTEGGIYIFDIFNAPLMAYFPTHNIIDAALEYEETKYVRYSSFAFDGLTSLLTITQKTHIQSGFDEIRTIDEQYQLQTYSKQALKDMVLQNGFSRVVVTGDGMRELFEESDMLNFVVCYK